MYREATYQGGYTRVYIERYTYPVYIGRHTPGYTHREAYTRVHTPREAYPPTNG